MAAVGIFRMAKVLKVAVSMLFLMTTIHGQLSYLVDVTGIGNGPSLGQRSLTNTDGSANGGVPRSSKRWIKCRSLMWTKECEEGSVVIATHKLTTEEGCDHFCSNKDQCQTFMYNTESLDCGLTTAIKGTTTSNGISGPELSVQKPSLRRGNRGRSKAAAEEEDCTGFHFFDCDLAFGKRDWPQDGLHRKGFWNPNEPNLQTCRGNCLDGGHGACGAYAWMDGTKGDMTKPGTCGIHSDNVDDLITFNCKWVTGRIGKIGGDPNELYSCLFDHNRQTLEKKLCRKGYCNLDHWGAPWDYENVEDEESCKSTCFYWSDGSKRHCTHYKFFQAWGDEAEKDPDYGKCELYTVEEGPHPSYKCKMQVYLKKRLGPLGLKSFHQQCRAPEISGGGNTTTDPPITRPTTPTPLTTDPVASCKSNPCQNGGFCQDGTCYCKNGFTGPKCEKAPKIDSSCKPNPCQNGGLCQDGTCYCKNGFSGSKCEIPAQTDKCTPNPCQNGGLCRAVDGSCSCTKDFIGEFCEVKRCKMVGEKKFYFPVVFVLDSTNSQKSSATLMIRLLNDLKITEATSYDLVTFHDESPGGGAGGLPPYRFPRKLNFKSFMRDVESVNFNNGGDFPEEVFKGLDLACQNAPSQSFIVAITDCGTKNLELEDKIKSCLQERDAILFIVNNPNYCPGEEESLKAYKRLANKVVNIADASALELKGYVQEMLIEKCQENVRMERARQRARSKKANIAL